MHEILIKVNQLKISKRITGNNILRYIKKGMNKIYLLKEKFLLHTHTHIYFIYYYLGVTLAGTTQGVISLGC